MKKKTNKKVNNKRSIKPRKTKKTKALFSFGNMDAYQGRILVLVVLIIFFSSILLIGKLLSYEEESVPVQTPTISVRKELPLEKEIKQMVQGYPIEKMVPYILQQDPKTAMFLVAIAKKESAWGEHHPVLDGQDCYNYWGFRLKAEKMGTGGHTCFGSPKEAVDAVANRLDQLIQNEDIDTPKDMIVWKCGYGCQDKPKTLSEKKWINDVDFYYSAMNDYL